jgi:hypothetical protein
VEGHVVYFTVGENIGRNGCSIPTGGWSWRAVRQPVVLAQWPVAAAAAADERFTTVASWRGAYGSVVHLGRTLGVKAHEFRRFVGLPRRTARTFEIALEIHEGDDRDRVAFLEGGWTLVDPRVVAGHPADFQRYVQGSWAEWSAAQGVYVHTNSGWFSDRTVRYLASGRPALVQDTGFSRNYPVGEGLVAFTTVEEAAEGARRIGRDYGAHSRAARAIAEEYFDSNRVLSEFVDAAGVAA